jgi:hypothetical protein
LSFSLVTAAVRPLGRRYIFESREYNGYKNGYSDPKRRASHRGLTFSLLLILWIGAEEGT